jgi:TolB protein
MYYDEDPFVPSEPPEKKRRVWWIIVSLIVIVGMLGSSVAGAIWLVQFWRAETAVSASDPTPAPIAPTAVVIEADEVAEIEEAEIEDESAVVETAVFPTPTPPLLETNRIVFINPRGRIGTIAPDGDDEQLLTSGSRRYVFPAWSPDGQSVASIGVDRQGATIDLFSDESNTDAVELYQSGSETPFYLYWSPDSQQISFLANHPREPMALHVVESDGESDSKMITTGGPFYWAWDPDSSQMLIHTGFSGDEAKLAFVNTIDEVPNDSIADPGFFQVPGISQDGRFIAYAEESLSGSRVVVINQETGKQYDAAHNGVVAMSWSPAANRLAYINSPDADGRGYIGPLRIVDAETNEVTLLSREPVLAFFWSPNGRYLLYMRYATDQNNDINAGLPRAPQRGVVSKPAQQFGAPDFDIVLIDTETGSGQILLQEVEFSRVFYSQFLPFFNQYALSHQIWSPASDAVVLPFMLDGQEQIAVLKINGGRVQPLTSGDMAFWSHQ